jgi:hypothetical protein
MKYIKSELQLNDFASKLSKHLKAPLTSIRSAIAKAEGFAHIAAFKQACGLSEANEESKTVSITLTEKEAYVMEQFQEWIDDNVSMGADLFFDNEGEVTSVTVAPVLAKLLRGCAVESTQPTNNNKGNDTTYPLYAVIIDDACVGTVGSDEDAQTLADGREVNFIDEPVPSHVSEEDWGDPIQRKGYYTLTD